MIKLDDVLYLITAKMFEIVAPVTSEVIAYISYSQEKAKVKMGDGLYCYDSCCSFIDDNVIYRNANVLCINPNEELTRIVIDK